MTRQRNFKLLVRERMKTAGERYAAARRFVLADRAADGSPHFAGSVPGATALRVLLAHAGLRDPKSKAPLSEAMAFGIAGGVGIGVFSFFYEKENFASFYVAGRHSWHDSETYFKAAAARLGLETEILESSGAKAAEKQLRNALKNGPAALWVDMTHLPYRGMPESWSGGGYHLVTIYGIDDAAGTASIGDLADEPISLPLADLALARGRIKKDKHRLLQLKPAKKAPDFAAALRSGLAACALGLEGAGAPKQAKRNFSLDSLSLWADRLVSTNSKDSERWERVFAPGKRMWTGLLFLHLFAEHYGSGGGLGRPLMADFLAESAEHLRAPALAAASERYAALGKNWSDLADAALPDKVAPLAEGKRLLASFAELFHGDAPVDEKRAVWKRLEEIGAACGREFPLSPAGCAELRAGLADRVRAIHAAEVEARRSLVDYLA
jgi:hypothetical protein